MFLKYSGGCMKKIKDYLQLMKPSLSIMVVFSSVISFLLTQGSDDYVRNRWMMILLLFAGGMLVTGSANAINQVVEKDTDALMKRTASRPVASGRMSVTEGWIFSIATGALGVFILGNYFNWLAAGLAAFSLFLYAFIYTPLKKVNSIAVLVGAVPGALPCLIGWAAGDNNLGIGGWVLFAFQFFWQFPHFWAIGWFLYDDYAKAGFYMLPTGKKDNSTALQTVLYSFWLLVASLLPALGYTGRLFISPIAAILVFLLGVWMIFYAIKLYQLRTTKAARTLMLVSVSYISLLQIIYIVDKFLR